MEKNSENREKINFSILLRKRNNYSEYTGQKPFSPNLMHPS